MADQFTTVANIQTILKNVYGEGLTNQFNDEKTTYNQFQKSDRKPAGLGYVFGVRRARTQSIGGRGDGMILPDPFTGKKNQGTITPVYVYGTLRINGPAIELAKGNTAAFVDSLSDEMDDIYQALVVDLNRQCWADGFGLLGTTTALATPSTSTYWSAVFDNVQYFQEGMLVDFYQSTAIDVTCVAQRVYSITPSTNTVTFEASGQTYLATHPIVAARSYTNDASTVASGSLCVKMGTRLASHAASDATYEITGLEGIYDDSTLLTTFENINASTYTFWQANILSNSSVARPLTLDLMLQAVDLARFRSGEKIKTIRMGLGQRRNYFGLLASDVRFAPTKFEGGYEKLAFHAGDGSVEMVIDPATQPGKMYFEPEGIIKKYELTPLGWGNLDNSTLHLRTSYDSYDAFLRLYTQLGCEMRNCLVKLRDLSEPSLFS